MGTCRGCPGGAYLFLQVRVDGESHLLEHGPDHLSVGDARREPPRAADEGHAPQGQRYSGEGLKVKIIYCLSLYIFQTKYDFSSVTGNVVVIGGV